MRFTNSQHSRHLNERLTPMKAVLTSLTNSMLAVESTGSALSWISMPVPAALAATCVVVLLQLAGLVYLSMRVNALQHQYGEQVERVELLTRNAVTRQGLESGLLNTLIGQQIDRVAALLRAELGLRLVPNPAGMDLPASTGPTAGGSLRSTPAVVRIQDLNEVLATVRILINDRLPSLPDGTDALQITSAELEERHHGVQLTSLEMDYLAAELNRALASKAAVIGQQAPLVTLRHRRSQDGAPNLALYVPRNVLCVL